MRIYDAMYYENETLVLECHGGVAFDWDDCEHARLYGKFLLFADQYGVDCVPLQDSVIKYNDGDVKIEYVLKRAAITYSETKYPYRKVVRRKGLTLDKHVKDLARRVLRDWKAGKLS